MIADLDLQVDAADITALPDSLLSPDEVVTEVARAGRSASASASDDCKTIFDFSSSNITQSDSVGPIGM
jgi:hypothetical protein